MGVCDRTPDFHYFPEIPTESTSQQTTRPERKKKKLRHTERNRNERGLSISSDFTLLFFSSSSKDFYQIGVRFHERSVGKTLTEEIHQKRTQRPLEPIGFPVSFVSTPHLLCSPLGKQRVGESYQYRIGYGRYAVLKT